VGIGCITARYTVDVRTTIRLDDDVAAAVSRLRRERHIGLSEAVNELARAGLRRGDTTRRPFRQRTHRLGLRIDVSNVAEALELLDESESAE
jgi:predicted transcriptional regulator